MRRNTCIFCCGMVLVLRALPLQAAEPVMVDNPAATLEGDWRVGTASSDKFGEDYAFAFCVSNAPTSTATYRPKLPEEGFYHVEIFYPQGSNRSTNGSWLISGQKGQTTVCVNQTQRGGEWVRLASSIPFAAGESGFARLLNQAPDAKVTQAGETVVVADAVRFVPTAAPDAAGAVPGENAAEGIIVDNGEAISEGKWFNNWYRGGKIDPWYRTNFAHTTSQPEITMTMTFRPRLATAGRYDVDVWHVSGENRTANAPWVIHGAEEDLQRFVDQRSNGGQWVRIASGVSFAAGTNGYAQISNGTGQRGATVVADAVRFAPSRLNLPALANPTVPTAASSGVLKLAVGPGGAVTRSPQLDSYPKGTSVTLEAKAEGGHIFAGWTGLRQRFQNPVTLTLDRELEVKAAFVRAGVGVIMDDTAAIFTGAAKNQWQVNPRDWSGCRYEGCRYISSTTGKPDSFATYRPQLPRAGLYDIHVWYSAGANRATNAPWEVVYEGGTLTVPVNQTVQGGDWQLLVAGKPFAQGTNGFVRLGNNAGPASSVVVADAVAFVFIRDK